MKVLTTSVVLVMALLPILSFGLKCYTCDASNDGPASCTPGQNPVKRDCTTHTPNDACFIKLAGVDRSTVALGCSYFDIANAKFEVDCSVTTETGPNGLSDEKKFKECKCKTDSCNKDERSKCVSCKGKPLARQWSGLDILQGSDYVCEAGEAPEARECQFEETICFSKNDGTKTIAGCREQKTGEAPPRDCVLEGCVCKGSLEGCVCKVNACNPGKKEDEKAGSTKLSSFSMVIAVALSSLVIHSTIIAL